MDDLPLYQVSYNRDLLGRIETQELIINGLVDLWSYQYDDAGRLEQVERNGLTEHVYVYDDNGNRTQHTGPGGVVTVANYDEQDRLTQYGDIVYTHTEAGERLTRTDANGTTTYTYDAHTNLRAVSLPDGTQIEYLIDGRDRRVGKKIDGVVQKTWIYRDQLSPVAQFDGDGNLTHRFVYAEQGHSPSWMVMIDPVTEEETVYRFITDHLGSVRLVINVTAGAVAQRIDYGPFGEVLFDSNPELQPFGFAGGIYDQHTGLVRFGARDYDPEIGSWTAKDPIGFWGGDWNLYGYVVGDPVNFIDPEGLAALACFRPLRGTSRVRYSAPDRRANTVIGHEHIFFEDGSDIGYGADGIYENGEDISEYSYCKTIDAKKEDIMNVVDSIKDQFPEEAYSIRPRWLRGNNCQDFVNQIQQGL